MVTYKNSKSLLSTPKSKNNNTESINLENNISHFYDGTVIFITGGTGFLGKALIEKLLRSCPGIISIYILMRPKRGLNVEQRLKEMLKNSVFERIREKTPEYFDKIKAIAGDVSQANLGVSEVDRNVLISSVNIAFHSAATVRFNENLKEAVILNTVGTKSVVKLCKEMKKLKSFVHVSTAYSNADKKEIDEVVYTPPFDPDSIIKCVDTLPLETINVIADRIQGKHPNTYTITKAMAEFVVQEHSANFPAAIVRPSIVTAAWKEPFEGWIDNLSGISGIMMEIGRGTIRSIICKDSYIIDVIPVDVVVNTLITAAWHNSCHRVNSVRVYNCTSGQVNGITWKDFGDLTLKYSIKYPSKYTTWYPGFTYRTNRIMHLFCHCFLHVFPAAFLDVLLFCTRHKPIMLKICNKFAQAAKHGTFFAMNEWKFENKCQKQLVEAVKKSEDGPDFSMCNMDQSTTFTWDNYVKNYVLGIRKFILKDDETTLEKARAKIKRLSWSKKVLQLLSLCMFLKVFYH